jgi:putative flippase GtrA
MNLLSNLFFSRFVKFCLVGGSGLIIDFGVTYFLKEKLKIQKYIANACGFCLAASSNYYLNRIWTFNSNNPNYFTEYYLFIFISVIGLGINSLILYLLVNKLKKHFYLSKVFVIGVVTIWNFVANSYITFAL